MTPVALDLRGQRPDPRLDNAHQQARRARIQTKESSSTNAPITASSSPPRFPTSFLCPRSNVTPPKKPEPRLSLLASDRMATLVQCGVNRMLSDAGLVSLRPAREECQALHRSQWRVLERAGVRMNWIGSTLIVEVHEEEPSPPALTYYIVIGSKDPLELAEYVKTALAEAPTDIARIILTGMSFQKTCVLPPHQLEVS